MKRARAAIVAIVIACGSVVALRPAAQSEVRLYVPAFDGPEALGLNVATVLNLQVWQTLRAAPTPNPRNLSFGRGTVVWDTRTLAEPTHHAAESAARGAGLDAQLTLWGKTYAYGDGVIVQAFLTRAETADDGPDVWRVGIPVQDGTIDLARRPTALRHAFEPIVLSPAIVAQYSEPTALVMYRTPGGGERVGVVGSTFRALEHGGDVVKVTSEGRTGWVRLPLLSRERSEVVDFAGGVIRVLREDWDGAAALLQRVTNNPHTPSAVRLDALLYLALADEKRGRSGRAHLEKALTVNPLAEGAAAALIMNGFADYRRAPSAARAAILTRIRRLLKENAFLFAADDPWFQSATQAHARLSDVTK